MSIPLESFGFRDSRIKVPIPYNIDWLEALHLNISRFLKIPSFLSLQLFLVIPVKVRICVVLAPHFRGDDEI